MINCVDYLIIDQAADTCILQSGDTHHSTWTTKGYVSTVCNKRCLCNEYLKAMGKCYCHYLRYKANNLLIFVLKRNYS